MYCGIAESINDHVFVLCIAPPLCRPWYCKGGYCKCLYCATVVLLVFVLRDCIVRCGIVSVGALRASLESSRVLLSGGPSLAIIASISNIIILHHHQHCFIQHVVKNYI